MKKILMTAALIFICSQSAFALSIRANGGAYIPQGSYKGMFDVGYDYGFTLDQKMFPLTYIQLDYHRYHAKGKNDFSGATLDGDAIELLLRFNPFSFVVSPYIAAGGGYYMNHIKRNTESFTQNGWGFVAEAGLDANFWIMSAGINARYFIPKVNGGGMKSNAESFTVGAQISINIPFTN